MQHMVLSLSARIRGGLSVHRVHQVGNQYIISCLCFCRFGYRSR